jgi:hypothetical protein
MLLDPAGEFVVLTNVAHLEIRRASLPHEDIARVLLAELQHRNIAKLTVVAGVEVQHDIEGLSLVHGANVLTNTVRGTLCFLSFIPQEPLIGDDEACANPNAFTRDCARASNDTEIVQVVSALGRKRIVRQLLCPLLGSLRNFAVLVGRIALGLAVGLAVSGEDASLVLVQVVVDPLHARYLSHCIDRVLWV